MSSDTPIQPARLRTAAEIDELVNDLLFARKELPAEERELLFRESNAMTRASHLRDLFRMTGNRLLFWQIYRVYRAADLPIPDDVLRELDRVAEGLESASGPVEIADVLGLTGRKGGPQGAAALRKARPQLEILAEVQYERERAKGRWPTERAYEIVGRRHGRSTGAIKRMWMDYEKARREYASNRRPSAKLHWSR